MSIKNVLPNGITLYPYSCIEIYTKDITFNIEETYLSTSSTSTSDGIKLEYIETFRIDEDTKKYKYRIPKNTLGNLYNYILMKRVSVETYDSYRGVNITVSNDFIKYTVTPTKGPIGTTVTFNPISNQPILYNATDTLFHMYKVYNILPPQVYYNMFYKLVVDDQDKTKYTSIITETAFSGSSPSVTPITLYPSLFFTRSTNSSIDPDIGLRNLDGTLPSFDVILPSITDVTPKNMDLYPYSCIDITISNDTSYNEAYLSNVTKLDSTAQKLELVKRLDNVYTFRIPITVFTNPINFKTTYEYIILNNSVDSTKQIYSKIEVSITFDGKTLNIFYDINPTYGPIETIVTFTPFSQRPVIYNAIDNFFKIANPIFYYKLVVDDQNKTKYTCTISKISEDNTPTKIGSYNVLAISKDTTNSPNFMYIRDPRQDVTFEIIGNIKNISSVSPVIQSSGVIKIQLDSTLSADATKGYYSPNADFSSPTFLLDNVTKTDGLNYTASIPANTTAPQGNYYVRLTDDNDNILAETIPPLLILVNRLSANPIALLPYEDVIVSFNNNFSTIPTKLYFINNQVPTSTEALNFFYDVVNNTVKCQFPPNLYTKSYAVDVTDNDGNILASTAKSELITAVTEITSFSPTIADNDAEITFTTTSDYTNNANNIVYLNSTVSGFNMDKKINLGAIGEAIATDTYKIKLPSNGIYGNYYMFIYSSNEFNPLAKSVTPFTYTNVIPSQDPISPTTIQENQTVVTLRGKNLGNVTVKLVGSEPGDEYNADISSQSYDTVEFTSGAPGTTSGKLYNVIVYSDNVAIPFGTLTITNIPPIDVYINDASPIKASYNTILTIILSNTINNDSNNRVIISKTSEFNDIYEMTDLTPVPPLSYTFVLSNQPPPGDYYVALVNGNNHLAVSTKTLFEVILSPESPESSNPPIVPNTVNQSGTVSLNGYGLNLITEVQLSPVSLRLGETFSFIAPFTLNPGNTQITLDISSASPIPPPGTYNVLGIYNAGTLQFGTLTITGNTPPFIICFKEDTKIACLQDNIETDIFIQNLKSGDLVKTYKHGYLPVNVVGRNICYNPKNLQRLKSRLFKLKKEKYPDLKEDLIVTGCHSILEHTVSHSKGEELMEVNKRIYTTDELIRLPAYLDDRSEPYVDECGDINVYHVALGNDESRNYGIYANGLLVESCFIPRIKNEMTIIS